MYVTVPTHDAHFETLDDSWPLTPKSLILSAALPPPPPPPPPLLPLLLHPPPLLPRAPRPLVSSRFDGLMSLRAGPGAGGRRAAGGRSLLDRRLRHHNG